MPGSSEVRFGDTALTGASEKDLTTGRREHVGFVFRFDNLILSLTVGENLALVTDIAKDPMPVDVSIARAIVKRPDVLLCDEPTGALDCVTGKLVLEVIARINVQMGTTAVVITHNAAIAGMADRVIHLGDGRSQKVEMPAHKISPSELRW